MSFNIDSSMIKLARDADEGVIPAEGQVSERGTVWKTGSGWGPSILVLEFQVRRLITVSS